MTSTNLVTIDTANDAELAVLTGQSSGEDKAYTFGFLGVNRELEDDDGHQLPVGQFRVLNGGASVFSPTVIVRPFLNVFQYSIYDAELKKYTRTSVFTKNIFQKEIQDDAGGFKCGKVSKKELAQLTAAEVEAQKRIRCSRYIFGLATIEGTNNAGNAASFVDVPVRMKLGGRNFMPIGEVLDGLTQKKLLMLNHNIALNITKEKVTKTVISYIINGVADISQRVSFTPANMDTLKSFQSYVDSSNDVIIAKWNKARGLASGATEAEFSEVSDSVALVDDLDDDVSDVK